jgi:hypothetical protein
MTGCALARALVDAWRFGDESQQSVTPHAWQAEASAEATQRGNGASVGLTPSGSGVRAVFITIASIV